MRQRKKKNFNIFFPSTTWQTSVQQVHLLEVFMLKESLTLLSSVCIFQCKDRDRKEVVSRGFLLESQSGNVCIIR